MHPRSATTLGGVPSSVPASGRGRQLDSAPRSNRSTLAHARPTLVLRGAMRDDSNERSPQSAPRANRSSRVLALPTPPSSGRRQGTSSQLPATQADYGGFSKKHLAIAESLSLEYLAHEEQLRQGEAIEDPQGPSKRASNSVPRRRQDDYDNGPRQPPRPARGGTRNELDRQRIFAGHRRGRASSGVAASSDDEEAEAPHGGTWLQQALSDLMHPRSATTLGGMPSSVPASGRGRQLDSAPRSNRSTLSLARHSRARQAASDSNPSFRPRSSRENSSLRGSSRGATNSARAKSQPRGRRQVASSTRPARGAQADDRGFDARQMAIAQNRSLVDYALEFERRNPSNRASRSARPAAKSNPVWPRSTSLRGSRSGANQARKRSRSKPTSGRRQGARQKTKADDSSDSDSDYDDDSQMKKAKSLSRQESHAHARRRRGASSEDDDNRAGPSNRTSRPVRRNSTSDPDWKPGRPCSPPPADSSPVYRIEHPVRHRGKPDWLYPTPSAPRPPLRRNYRRVNPEDALAARGNAVAAAVIRPSSREEEAERHPSEFAVWMERGDEIDDGVVVPYEMVYEDLFELTEEYGDALDDIIYHMDWPKDKKGDKEHANAANAAAEDEHAAVNDEPIDNEGHEVKANVKKEEDLGELGPFARDALDQGAEFDWEAFFGNNDEIVNDYDYLNLTPTVAVDDIARTEREHRDEPFVDEEMFGKKKEEENEEDGDISSVANRSFEQREEGDCNVYYDGIGDLFNSASNVDAVGNEEGDGEHGGKPKPIVDEDTESEEKADVKTEEKEKKEGEDGELRSDTDKEALPAVSVPSVGKEAALVEASENDHQPTVEADQKERFEEEPQIEEEADEELGSDPDENADSAISVAATRKDAALIETSENANQPIVENVQKERREEVPLIEEEKGEESRSVLDVTKAEEQKDKGREEKADEKTDEKEEEEDRELGPDHGKDKTADGADEANAMDEEETGGERQPIVEEEQKEEEPLVEQKEDGESASSPDDVKAAEETDKGREEKVDEKTDEEKEEENGEGGSDNDNDDAMDEEGTDGESQKKFIGEEKQEAAVEPILPAVDGLAHLAIAKKKGKKSQKDDCPREAHNDAFVDAEEATGRVDELPQTLCDLEVDRIMNGDSKGSESQKEVGEEKAAKFAAQEPQDALSIAVSACVQKPVAIQSGGMLSSSATDVWREEKSARKERDEPSDVANVTAPRGETREEKQFREEDGGDDARDEVSEPEEEEEVDEGKEKKPSEGEASLPATKNSKPARKEKPEDGEEKEQEEDEEDREDNEGGGSAPEDEGQNSDREEDSERGERDDEEEWNGKPSGGTIPWIPSPPARKEKSEDGEELEQLDDVEDERENEGDEEELEDEEFGDEESGDEIYDEEEQREGDEAGIEYGDGYEQELRGEESEEEEEESNDESENGEQEALEEEDGKNEEEFSGESTLAHAPSTSSTWLAERLRKRKCALDDQIERIDEECEQLKEPPIHEWLDPKDREDRRLIRRKDRDEPWVVELLRAKRREREQQKRDQERDRHNPAGLSRREGCRGESLSTSAIETADALKAAKMAVGMPRRINGSSVGMVWWKWYRPNNADPARKEQTEHKNEEGDGQFKEARAENAAVMNAWMDKRDWMEDQVALEKIKHAKLFAGIFPEEYDVEALKAMMEERARQRDERHVRQCEPGILCYNADWTMAWEGGDGRRPSSVEAAEKVSKMINEEFKDLSNEEWVRMMKESMAMDAIAARAAELADAEEDGRDEGDYEAEEDEENYNGWEGEEPGEGEEEGADVAEPSGDQAAKPAREMRAWTYAEFFSRRREEASRDWYDAEYLQDAFEEDHIAEMAEMFPSLFGDHDKHRREIAKRRKERRDRSAARPYSEDFDWAYLYEQPCCEQTEEDLFNERKLRAAYLYHHRADKHYSFVERNLQQLSVHFQHVFGDEAELREWCQKLKEERETSKARWAAGLFPIDEVFEHFWSIGKKVAPRVKKQTENAEEEEEEEDNGTDEYWTIVDETAESSDGMMQMDMKDRVRKGLKAAVDARMKAREAPPLVIFADAEEDSEDEEGGGQGLRVRDEYDHGDEEGEDRDQDGEESPAKKRRPDDNDDNERKKRRVEEDVEEETRKKTEKEKKRRTDAQHKVAATAATAARHSCTPVARRHSDGSSDESPVASQRMPLPRTRYCDASSSESPVVRQRMSPLDQVNDSQNKTVMEARRGEVQKPRASKRIRSRSDSPDTEVIEPRHKRVPPCDGPSTLVIHFRTAEEEAAAAAAEKFNKNLVCYTETKTQDDALKKIAVKNFPVMKKKIEQGWRPDGIMWSCPTTQGQSNDPVRPRRIALTFSRPRPL